MRALAILAVLTFPAAALAQLSGQTYAAMPAAGVRVEHWAQPAAAPASRSLSETQTKALTEARAVSRELQYCCQQVQFAQPWERERLFERTIRLRLRLRVLLRFLPSLESSDDGGFELGGGFSNPWGWNGGGGFQTLPWGGGGFDWGGGGFGSPWGIQPFDFRGLRGFGGGGGFDFQGPFGGNLYGGFNSPFGLGGGGVDPFCPSCPRSGYAPMPPADQAAPSPQPTLPGGGGGYYSPAPGLNQQSRPIPPLSQLPLQRYSRY